MNTQHKYATPDGKKLVFVNAYSVCRCYGGPEEGGWWYDSGRPLASVPVIEDDETVIEMEKKRITELMGWPVGPTRQGRYSVIGGDDFEICVEDEPGQPYPAERPHYE